jgi:histidinol-phosphate aminotransferase
MQQGMQSLGLKTIPSSANFVLVHVGHSAPDTYQQLLRGGVIVRPVAGYGLAEYLRVSIGLPEQNDLALRLLAGAVESTR